MYLTYFEHGRYFVTTEKGSEYLIDIEALDRNGWCGCRDFQYRHLPTLEREIKEPGRIEHIRRCRHLKHAAKELIEM